MVVRIIAFGLLGYLREPWNCFDGAMVLAGYTSLMQSGDGSGSTSSFKALRALRALRPLRTITRFQSLRSVVVCFLEVRFCLLSTPKTECVNSRLCLCWYLWWGCCSSFCSSLLLLDCKSIPMSITKLALMIKPASWNLLSATVQMNWAAEGSDPVQMDILAALSAQGPTKM